MLNILLIGATSSIANACARQWQVRNAIFFLVARNSGKLCNVADDLRARGSEVRTYELDLSRLDQHARMLDACYATMDKIDIVLIAHGTLPDQQACEKNAELAVQEFSNNGLSVIALLTHLGTRMQQQGDGVIAVISSVAADRGRPSNYLYGSAKSAVNAYCSGMRARLFKSGVHVLTIEPGFVDTPMTRDLSLPRALVVSREKVAADIVKAVDKRRDVLYTPWFWRYIMLIIIHLPNFIFKRMSL
jgi:short-subunit dehydrogenase